MLSMPSFLPQELPPLGSIWPVWINDPVRRIMTASSLCLPLMGREIRELPGSVATTGGVILAGGGTTGTGFVLAAPKTKTDDCRNDPNLVVLIFCPYHVTPLQVEMSKYQKATHILLTTMTRSPLFIPSWTSVGGCDSLTSARLNWTCNNGGYGGG